MRRQRHEPLPPEALDEPFGPPPEEYRYRCSVCGEVMLVHEAIIDVAIGAAKVITIYGILCFSYKEVPPMAHLQFTDVQTRSTEFLDVTSLTLDEFQQLVLFFEAAF